MTSHTIFKRLGLIAIGLTCFAFLLWHLFIHESGRTLRAVAIEELEKQGIYLCHANEFFDADELLAGNRPYRSHEDGQFHPIEYAYLVGGKVDNTTWRRLSLFPELRAFDFGNSIIIDDVFFRELKQFEDVREVSLIESEHQISTSDIERLAEIKSLRILGLPLKTDGYLIRYFRRLRPDCATQPDQLRFCWIGDSLNGKATIGYLYKVVNYQKDNE